MLPFQRKKVQIETLSEYLSAIRNNLNLTVDEVSDKTGIKSKFLQALERGDFLALPADVYVLGFLAKLGRMYSINAEVLVSQYKKEKGIHQNLVKPLGFSPARWYRPMFNKLVVTPKILSIALGLTLVALTLIYIVWQVWSINRLPSLQVFSPENFSTVAGAAVEVSGSTDAGMAVSINGQNVFVDSRGGFQTQLGLSPGPKEIVIVAKNRFGKQLSKTITVTAASPANNPEAGLELKVSFTGSVSLGFSIDGQAMKSLEFSAGSSTIFTARQKILLSTSNAGATLINLNGNNLGSMGKPDEKLENVPFVASFGQ